MLKERLLNLPNEIEELKIEILTKQEKVSTIKDKLKMWELTEMSYIANEVDDNGKPKYSNDVKRNAELQHRKDQSEDYLEHENALRALEREVAVQNIFLDKLYNEQGNLRAICRLEGGAVD